MTHEGKSLILVVDDDESVLAVIERMLEGRGYRVVTSVSGLKALEAVKYTKPDLILLDILMPDMDGYELCARLQMNEETAYIPVIFISVLGTAESKAKAFAAGCVDYLVKPFTEEMLVHKTDLHLRTNQKFKQLREEEVLWDERVLPSNFSHFKEFLAHELALAPERAAALATVKPNEIYSALGSLAVTEREMAKCVASFLKLDYSPHINPEDVQLGVLPAPFCKANQIIPVGEASRYVFILANPFNWELIDVLKKFVGQHQFAGLKIAEPKNIDSLLKETYSIPAAKAGGRAGEKTEENLRKSHILYITDNILDTAVSERASDIHIEPKEKFAVVRCRIDGDMQDMFTLRPESAVRVISRLKTLGGMDITEKRKPQDGTLDAVISERNFKLRLSTTSTPHGESLVIRLLEPEAKPKRLETLGMTDEQVAAMMDFAGRTQGFILFVGPTGSGKTTTVYSLLDQVDIRKRSLISVEDPVEYRIPLANQQQVNEKAGITFESLLKSTVRQDPDILFIGEIRDPNSAKVAIDFASAGRLTVTTLHTSNATTAVFRFERLGVSRSVFADTVVGIVAQRLLKKLCNACKKIEPISDEEKEMLRPFTADMPKEVAHAVGCSKCSNTGYFSREGVYEILKFDPSVIVKIRSGVPISEIREYMRSRGDFLISHHAVEKVRKLVISPRDAYEKVLVEEAERAEKRAPAAPAKERKGGKSILIVEDDKDSQALIQLILANQGYDLTLASDGIEALLALGKKDFDLILSDIAMPNLDGFKLVEMLGQKGVNAPVVFLTAKTGEAFEVKGLELGAVDFIRKPIKKEILLLRVKTALEKGAQAKAA